MNAKLIIILIPFSQKMSGQLVVNAGNDTTVCNCTNSLKLGGFPTASGGEEPYTYCWEVISGIPVEIPFITSDLLNDSTLANPQIECFPFINDTVTFVLTITDRNSITVKDSVDIIISSISLTYLTYLYQTINQGDSAKIYPYNIFNGIPPFSYHWIPESYLSDPYIANPFASPDTSTKYYCLVTDAIGCSSTDFVHVLINPTGIPAQTEIKNKSFVYPNPIQSHSIISFNPVVNKNLIIEVINTAGQVIINDLFNSDSYEIGKKIDKNGLYFYRIKNHSKILTFGQFIKQ